MGGRTATRRSTPLAALVARLSVVMLADPPVVAAFMYRPAAGLVWDPSCFVWNRKTFCYFMYVCGIGTPGCTQNETHCETLQSVCWAAAAAPA